MNLTSLSEGYYKDLDSSIYYKCIENCNECNNNYECLDCSDNYVLQYHKCFKEIEYCNNYGEDGKCIGCDIGYKVKSNTNSCERGEIGCADFDETNNICNTCEVNYTKIKGICYKEVTHCKDYTDYGECLNCDTGFAFEENNREICKDKSHFSIGYFTKDDEISFYKCDTETEGVEHCSECNYETDKVVCTKCSSDYILLDDETDTCYFKGDCNSDNKKCYKIDDYHFNRCSKGNDNCFKCVKNDTKA